MVKPGRDRLAGSVEVDEKYLGGLESGGLEEDKQVRQTEKKALIAVAAQEEGRSIGCIRMRRFLTASGASLVPFVRDAVELSSMVHTDGWLGFEPLERNGYCHRVPSFRATRSLRLTCCRGFIGSSRC